MEQGEKEMLGLDGGMLEAGRRHLGGLEGLLRTLGEPVETHDLCIPRAPRR
jgi:hypothetical protein